MKYKRSELDDGKILRKLIKQFHEDQSVKNEIQILECLRDSYIYMPCDIIICNKDMKKFENSNVGDYIKTEEEIIIRPDSYKLDDEIIMPIFSCKEEMNKCYKTYHDSIKIHFIYAMKKCLEDEKYYGLTIDVNGYGYGFSKEMFNSILCIPSNVIDDE